VHLFSAAGPHDRLLVQVRGALRNQHKRGVLGPGVRSGESLHPIHQLLFIIVSPFTGTVEQDHQRIFNARAQRARRQQPVRHAQLGGTDKFVKAKVFEHDSEQIAAKRRKKDKIWTGRPQRQEVFTEGNEGNEG
jgi:hypothetical protein